MSGSLMERLQLIKVLDPVADAFDSTPTTEVIDMSEFLRILFIVHAGVGATGSSTFTVEACSNVTPSAVAAIPFLYREITTGDTEGAIALAATTGVVNTVGSSRFFCAEVREDALASTGYRYVRLKAVESVNSPVLAGILALGEKKNQRAIATSAID